ncbi:MAG: hypothetical protein SYC29_05410 [Planctomycetota bacterium]|nr:hypothetical protein [Planctomycetota bacterium]
MRKLTFLTLLLAVLALATGGRAGVAPLDFVYITGELTITEVTEDMVYGDLTGDVVGDFEAVIVGSEEYELPFGTVVVLFTESLIITEDGTITMEDIIYTVPIGGSGISYWVGQHDINGGTGAFEDAFGGILTRGVVPPEGPIMLGYYGLVGIPE